MSNANTTPETSAITGHWKVTDPARIAAGLYGTTFHDTRDDAEERVRMFPGSVMEWVEGAAS